MTHRLIGLFASAALLTVGTLAAPPRDADAKTVFRKVAAKGSVLTEKNGYWVECRDSGLGQICETVYARAKNGKFRRLAAKAGKITTANGYVTVCYDGSHNAVVCYTVYERVKASR